ncbi:PREDICTED: uncharacterized protein LOC108762993 [Trachymyrmex cornetzi]|uniref:uncharacterized protein LOC108762993 n=1 Tax=Trachymyrmex cornetzi TaxID=471704 RepID=UPI00084F7407|nr:PREDICTED: uncharacterized protein LOC108762993 [Trachymyrmex cornetzi]
MRAACHIEVPREIAAKRAVINVHTMDNACFAWSVVAALYPAEKYTERESSYPHYTTVLNLTGIEFPVTLRDIPKFERLNTVSINVYGIENKQVLPLRLTSDKKEKHVNVLYLQDPRNDGVGHFAWIKNLSRLVSSQLSRKKNKKLFCDRCLHYFGSSQKLQTHEVDCQKLNDCAIRLPSENDRWLEFGNHCNRERVPFVVYADLECVLRKTEPNKEDASSYEYQQHEVFSIGYYVRCSYDDTLSAYQFRRDKNSYRCRQPTRGAAAISQGVGDPQDPETHRSQVYVRGFINIYNWVTTRAEREVERLFREHYTDVWDDDSLFLAELFGLQPYEDPEPEEWWSLHTRTLLCLNDRFYSSSSSNTNVKPAAHEACLPAEFLAGSDSCHRIGCGADSASMATNPMAII